MFPLYKFLEDPSAPIPELLLFFPPPVGSRVGSWVSLWQCSVTTCLLWESGRGGEETGTDTKSLQRACCHLSQQFHFPGKSLGWADFSRGLGNAQPSPALTEQAGIFTCEVTFHLTLSLLQGCSGYFTPSH